MPTRVIGRGWRLAPGRRPRRQERPRTRPARNPPPATAWARGVRGRSPGPTACRVPLAEPFGCVRTATYHTRSARHGRQPVDDLGGGVAAAPSRSAIAARSPARGRPPDPRRQRTRRKGRSRFSERQRTPGDWTAAPRKRSGAGPGGPGGASGLLLVEGGGRQGGQGSGCRCASHQPPTVPRDRLARRERAALQGCVNVRYAAERDERTATARVG